MIKNGFLSYLCDYIYLGFSHDTDYNRIVTIIITDIVNVWTKLVSS